jgi:hypothetical protein
VIGSQHGHSAALVDESRPGSVRSQVLIGITGIVLGIVLIVGQVSVATTNGMSANLHRNVSNLEAGNATLEEIVEKAQPTRVIQQVVARQGVVLDRTVKTMQALNGEMAQVADTTSELEGSVKGMQATSGELARGVEGMSRDSAEMARMLETLPDATTRTNVQLDRINADSTALNGELRSVGRKMERYGLPKAKHVGGRQ